MGIVDFLALGVGLSMDAFAVAVCKGLAMRKVNIRQCFIIALFFGGFQALMPLLGYALGSTFAIYVKSIDHWVAFILLAYIGIKMIIDAIKERNEKAEAERTDPPLDIKQLFIMAIATSIDALAIGITFSFMEVNIWSAISVIGLTTFILSVVAVFIGNVFGMKFKAPAQITGGVILIILGIRILISHLFFGG
ncbi:MAG: manganese efflux pump MntP family protein [Lachnospiraceae bacterium]|nr:manganese efflux pump MntP family protein [Lachnospiraceae bacterium]